MNRGLKLVSKLLDQLLEAAGELASDNGRFVIGLWEQSGGQFLLITVKAETKNMIMKIILTLRWLILPLLK